MTWKIVYDRRYGKYVVYKNGKVYEVANSREGAESIIRYAEGEKQKRNISPQTFQIPNPKKIIKRFLG